MKQLTTGAVCLVVCLLVVAADSGHQWSWPLVGWGLLVGLVGVAGTFGVSRFAGISSARWDAFPSFILMAVGLAVLAGGLDSPWPDVAFAAYVGIANFAVPIALLPRLRPPAAHVCSATPSDSCGPAACAACPLAAQPIK